MSAKRMRLLLNKRIGILTSNLSKMLNRKKRVHHFGAGVAMREGIIRQLQTQRTMLKSQQRELKGRIAAQKLERLKLRFLLLMDLSLKRSIYRSAWHFKKEGVGASVVKVGRGIGLLVRALYGTLSDAMSVILYYGFIQLLPGYDCAQLTAPVPYQKGQEALDKSAIDTRSYDVIIFPIIDWDFRFQRPQQLAVQWAKAGHRVFYLHTTFHSEEQPVVREIQERVYEVQLPGPVYINIYTDSIDESLAENICHAFISLRRKFGIVEAVCILDLPFWKSVAFNLRERFGWKVVYDCMDYHAGFSTNKDQMLKEERSLSLGSDLIMASSRLILAEQSQLNQNCVLIPNAADFEHFHSAGEDLPQEIKNLKRPIIGYYGAISDWFDTEMVRTLARARPAWSFVLIGSTFGAALAPLKGRKNIHLLGEKPYTVLPSYLSAFDVCIIPFRKTPLTEATNPVKVFEFLSAGKAVVATELEELKYYSDYIQLTTGTAGWLNAIERSLNDYSPERVEARVDFARQNTWDERSSHIQRLIQTLYPKASLIIVSYNNLDFTKLCIESIIAKTHYPNLEIIIVDNNSTDGTREYFEELSAHSNVKIVLNDRNEGFAKANNKGILAASGEYIVFLNNDTMVTRGWLTRLLRHLEDERIGMVGPVTNFCGNEARIDVSYTTVEELEEFSEKYLREHMEPECFDIKVLAMYCLAMRKREIDEIGLLDERFQIGMFEDDDYAHRIRLKGHRVVCAEDVFIHHFGETSFSKLKKSGEYMKIFEENKKRYEEKWGIKWEPHKYREVKEQGEDGM
jgi:GT2 family glycosyltransferase/glycosyltransferase involved in cell wall biosynthesis